MATFNGDVKMNNCQVNAPIVKRRSDDGRLAECPMCGSMDIGGAHQTVSCYGCGLSVTKPAPLQNAVDAWNTRGGKTL